MHMLLVAQGALLFGFNYIPVYRAELHVASGLVAVLFSTMVFMSLVGTRLVFGTPDHGAPSSARRSASAASCCCSCPRSSRRATEAMPPRESRSASVPR